MTTRVLTARPTMPIKEVARVLSEHRIGALPVLDVDDRLVGVVSQFDLLARQADPVPEPARWWWGRASASTCRS